MLEFMYRGEFMKKLLYLFVFLAAFTAVYAQERTEPQLPDTLNTIIKAENPNAYQKAQIIKFFNDTIYAAQLEENKEDILRIIDQELPASAIRSYSFKDAFPQAKGKDPKGFFDSYNRALFSYSVLQALKQNEGVHIADLGNKAFLTFKKITPDTDEQKTIYIYPTEPDEIYPASQEEIDSANIFYTQEDIKSLILTRAAQAKIKEGNGDELAEGAPDAAILKQAETLLKQAITLNPRNITALNEMRSLINVMPHVIYNSNPDKANRKKLEISTNYAMLILALKVANFNNNYMAKAIDPFICNNTPVCPKKSKAPSAAPFINALQENAEIRDYTADIMLSLYSLDKYQPMLYLGNEYAKIKDLDNIANIHNFYFQMAMVSAINGNYKNFQKFKLLFDKKYPAISEEYENLNIKLNNTALAMEIVSGKKTAAKIAQEYNSGTGGRLHNYIVTDHVNDSTVEAALALKGWKGYNNFRNKVLNMID